MAMDQPGFRATQLARAAITVAYALGLIGATYFVSMLGVTAIYNRRVAFPELLMLSVATAALVGLHWLRAFLRDVTAGQVFTIVNAQRLSRIGWLLIGVAVLRTVVPFLFGGLVSFYSPGMILPMLFGIVVNTWLVSGLLLLVIAAAWRYGSELQNERDLTV